MKFKNKKTGEIRPAEAREDGIYLYDETTEQWYKYELDLLAKWWDYYEEPKEDYIRVINSFIHYVEEAEDSFYCNESVHKFVDKLKAWKRLKDKVQFKGWQDIANPEVIWVGIDAEHLTEQDQTDLDLLFGGEE